MIGQVNDGWTVASRLLFHERDAVGGGSPYVSGVGRRRTAEHGGQRSDLAELARATGQADDPLVRQLVAEARVNDRVQTTAHRAGDHRVSAPGRSRPRPAPCPGSSPPPTPSVASTSDWRSPAPAAGAWVDGDPAGLWGKLYLTRQSNSLGGGSNEMQRNIISERVLGMPREFAADRDRPFDEVRHNRSPQHRS